MHEELTAEDRPPPPDMKLRRLAIDAGLTEETDVDRFHKMAEAMGLKLMPPQSGPSNSPARERK